MKAWPNMPADDATLVITPPPLASIDPMVARAMRKGPLRFTSMRRSHSATSISWVWAKRKTPATLARMRVGPSSFSTVATAAATLSSSRTSTLAATAVPPERRIIATVSSTASAWSRQPTWAPSAASRSGGGPPYAGRGTGHDSGASVEATAFCHPGCLRVGSVGVGRPYLCNENTFSLCGREGCARRL